MATPALGDDVGCFLQNQAGDRFEFTDNHFIWHYRPTKGLGEFCAYGIDPDVGWFTITCPDHGIDAMVTAPDHGNTVEIDGAMWSRQCESSSLDLGL